MKGRMIYLLRFGEIDLAILMNLEKHLNIAFEGYNIKVDIHSDVIQLDNLEYNLERGQYNASRILEEISKRYHKKYIFRILGVMDKDIYKKDYNFIFGTARFLSKEALISVTRLRDEFYKESGVLYKKHTNNNEFDLRVFKEAFHELGHTFGLEHCYNFCIMQFSNCLADTDNKPEEFCNICLEYLISSLK